MDLFKAAQRIPPRRLPVVKRYTTLPAFSSVPIMLPNKRPPLPLTVIGGVVGLALVAGLAYLFSDSDQVAAVVPATHRPSGAPVPSASFRVIRPGDAGGGGGGGGGGAGYAGPAAGPLIQEKAAASVVSQVRKLVFTLKKDPSTPANLTDRLSVFAKYFNSLSPSDRIAMFGTTDFRQVEHAIRKRGDKGPLALDRCLAQLQLILF